MEAQKLTQRGDAHRYSAQCPAATGRLNGQSGRPARRTVLDEEKMTPAGMDSPSGYEMRHGHRRSEIALMPFHPGTRSGGSLPAALLPPFLLERLRGWRDNRLERRVASLTRANAQHRGSESGRCFIIGSGPSVAGLDFGRLAPFGSIALNNLVAHTGYADLQAKHHLIAPIHPPQTETQWSTWLATLSDRLQPHTRLWAGVGMGELSARRIIERNQLFPRNPISFYQVIERSVAGAAQRIEFDRPLAPAMTASVYAIGLALWLGYTEIILLGIDHSYFLFEDESKMRFYGVGEHQRGEGSVAPGSSAYADQFLAIGQIFHTYRDLAEQARIRGAIILNGTDRTVNKMFPQIDYDRATDPRPIPSCPAG